MLVMPLMLSRSFASFASSVPFVSPMFGIGSMSGTGRAARRGRSVLLVIHTGMRVSHDDFLLLPP